MSATITATAHVCTVSLNPHAPVLTITAPNGKVCLINLDRARKIGLTMAQMGLLAKVREAAGGTVRLTIPEMKVLVSIRDKQGTITREPAKEVQQKTVHATANGTDLQTRGTGNGSDEVGRAEAEVRRLQKSAKTLAGNVYMLIYDIPESLNEVCPNPSGQLWRQGFRLNKSCWVLPQKSLDSSTVNELLDHWKEHPRVECHIIPYAERALNQIREIAAEKIRQRVVEIHTSFIKRLDAASERLARAREELDQVSQETPEIVSSRDYERLEVTRDNNVRSILKQSAEALEAAIDCAKLFDEEENLADLFEGLRQAVRSQVLSFNATMEQKKGKRSTVQV